MIHMKYGSSTAARTDACPGWHRESEGIPRGESAAAIDGTIVHGILEAWNLDEDTPRTVEGNKVEQDHLDMAHQMADAQAAVFERYDIVDYEPEVTGKADEDVGGTLDLVALTKRGWGLLLDYKTGRGVQVDAVGNKQILFAAATALQDSCMKRELSECEKFIGVILQPDLHGEVQTKVWEFDRDTVDIFWEHHSKQIALSRTDDAPLAAGDHCRFCPAAPFCPEKNGQAQAALRMDPTDLTTLAEALDLCEDLDQWIKDVKKTAMEQLEAGASVPGWKLKPKRATESWDDVEGALKKLRRHIGGKKEFMQEKPITPAAARKKLVANGMEKSVADELVSSYTVRKSSGMNMARADDDAIDVSPAAVASAIQALA